MSRSLASILALTALLTPSVAHAAPADSPAFTVEAIYGKELNGPRLLQQRWRPDGSALSYLLDDREERVELWIANPQSGDTRPLVDSAALGRIVGTEGSTADALRAADYRWAPDGKSIAFLVSGRLKIYNLEDGTILAPAPSKTAIEDPQFSPRGEWIAFVHEHDLWIVPAGGGEERRLTFGGSETLLHGAVDWVYEEEFDLATGYAWSPDGRAILFFQMDLQSVPVYPIVDELERQATVRFQRYPKPGEANPRVRVGMVEIATGRTAWLDRSAEYVPRILWADASTVAVQLLNRAQNELELVLADAATGRSRSILLERDEQWINVSDDVRFLAGSGDMLWTSERSGYRHLYRYDRRGGLKLELTAGAWEIKEIEGVDEQGGWVYFSSNEANPLGSDLYRVRLDGGERQRITDANGTHSVTMNELAGAFVDQHSSLGDPPSVVLRRVAGGPALSIHQTPSVKPLNLVEPEIVELNAHRGSPVRIKLLKPRDASPEHKLPVVLYVYGGPRAPVVRDAWRHQTELFHQLLVQRGFVVAYVDDRSSARLGHEHEVAVSRNWGPHVVEDHESAVEYLRTLPFVDSQRMAVWGWSGGGYVTCYHMTHTDLFKVGIAVAPVTDWRLYDSIYTERYMGLPQNEPEAYAATSIVEAAGNLRGRLLVIHGTGDDNVHPQNTTQLVQALIEAGKPVDLMLYPGKRHGIRGTKARVHLFGKILSYLEQHL